jgi:hypothetical protein
MDNRITEIRIQIRKLRTNMLRAEAVMRDQINHDEDCTIVAEELLHMRAVMRELVQERASLGDTEPVLVDTYFVPRRPLAPKVNLSRPASRRAAPVDSQF